MNLELGKSIMTSDGAQAGTVDQFVVDPKTRDLVAIISREGFIFTEDRIIEADHIDRVDDDGTIHLNLTQDRVEHLRPVASARFMRPDEYDDAGSIDRDTFIGASGTGQLLVASTGSYSPIAPAPASLFEPADADPPPMEVESNFPENAVALTEGTDVIDSNGKKIGEVEEIVYADHEVEALVVEAGFLFHHKVRVPADWISSFTHEAVQLNRAADDVEREGRVEQ